jgi:site-specific DNA-methyltransferase (adenine-specific)
MSDHRIVLGDCLDPLSGLASLPDGSADVTLTDPPYSAHVHAKGRRAGKGWNSGGGAKLSEDRPLGFDHLDSLTRQRVAVEIARVTRRWSLVFCDIESVGHWKASLVRAGLVYRVTCLWRKVNGAPNFTGLQPAASCEAIVCAHRPGRFHWNGGGKQGFYESPVVMDRGAGESRVHTTQKPVALMEALVRDFTDKGEIVLDPFAGSGTTGVACRRLGRRFLGWERDERYAAIAEKRIAGAREQMRMFEGTGT